MKRYPVRWQKLRDPLEAFPGSTHEGRAAMQKETNTCQQPETFSFKDTTPLQPSDTICKGNSTNKEGEENMAAKKK